MAKFYKSKKREHYLTVPEVPDEINEIISYLSMDFSKNKLFERDDLAQDLYALYAQMLKKDPKAHERQKGWYFMKFKWFLLTKWRKRIREIEKEWRYRRSKGGDTSIFEEGSTDMFNDMSMRRFKTGSVPKASYERKIIC